MKRTCMRISVVIAFVLLSIYATASGQDSSRSIDEYRNQLAAISERVDSLHEHAENAGAVVASIPDKTTVRTSAGEITVSYSDLKADLTQFAKTDSEKRSRLLPEIQEYVRTLSRDAASFDGPARPEAHKKLDRILAHTEFHSHQGPNAKDVLLAKLFGWLFRLLDRLTPGNTSFNWFQVVIYTIIGAAMMVILVWTLRRLRGRREEVGPREIVPFAPSARSWHLWLAEARALARQQDWRNAIHMAYWAGVSFLEEHGAWKPNRARTPREYLRLMGARTPKYPPLAALTRQLELVWYGYAEAAESDFNEALAQLEKLGCR
jgi:hypothetical protein